jgi:hypothetical protein
MDKILNRICSIDNHPIAKMDEKFRIQYVEGLAACLYYISKGSDIAKMITFAWVNSIHAIHDNLNSLWTANTEAVKKAISLHRKGIKFFYMRESFFFDVFYLAQASVLGEAELEKSSEYLRKNVCGFFSKKSLNKILVAYKTGESCIDGVSSTQITHRKTNNKVLSGTEKKILVVADVSAGKSTLINALVGYRLNRIKTTVCTDKLVYIHNKCSNDGITIKRNNGTYTYSSNINEGDSDTLIEAAFPFKSTLGNEHICFIDTPGINNVENISHKQITEEVIKKGNYDAVLYISNCQYFGTNDEHNLLKFLKLNVTKPILFILNQLDVFNPEEDSIPKMLNDYKSDLMKIGFKNPTIIPISAYASLLFRLDSSCLTKIDVIKKHYMIELFKEKYYHLPQYIGQEFSTELIEMTGIKTLESEIIRI